MSTIYHIVNDPLPLAQDFRSLKKEGLAFIQKVSGNSWTNLNVSDPGVTILEQFCYALTELGYCNEFPVHDILTGSDGKLQVKDQFYLPEEILTTSPVTVSDYIKSLIDNVNGVSNAIILSELNNDKFSNGIYRVYLQIDPQEESTDRAKNICKAALYHLNNCRNLGELFFMPEVLKACNNEITGTITIDKKANVSKILVDIQNAIRNFIFPPATQVSYTELCKQGFETNDIFNGPAMKNGWIVESKMGSKKDKINPNDLTNVIKTVDGIETVSELKFTSASDNPYDPLYSPVNKVINVDILKSIEKGILIINYLKREVSIPGNIQSSLQLIQSQNTQVQVVLGDAGNNPAYLPEGKFRDIDTYYSIQNTFPEIFAIGPDSMDSGAEEYEIAQSRQLKGYLTLFDQLIANQFSQLANVNRLFSFKNAMTGIPTSESEYFAKMDSQEKENQLYPVPYMNFSPTYFYQALYHIPHIKPLLKDHDIFDYSDELLSEKELQYNSWLKYQQYPYNSYMKGLTEFMENEAINVERRNTMLDHLLARHGESPLMLDTIIDGSVYSGNSIKDKVIFKSLYLQNLGLISYYRQKGYNFMGANKILNYPSALKADTNEDIYADHSIDFIFDSSKINYNEEIYEDDFRQYSALELKLCLLFGLKSLYRNYIANLNEGVFGLDKRILASWMIQERKGFILIETSLLRQYQFISGAKVGDELPEYVPASDNGIELIFPKFIQEFNEDFKDRLDFFLENTCPVHVPYKKHFVDCILLKKLIDAYVNWHNSLIYDNYAYTEETAIASNILMDVMQEINSQR